MMSLQSQSNQYIQPSCPFNSNQGEIGNAEIEGHPNQLSSQLVPVVTYYDNGKIKNQHFLKDGVKHGISQTFFQDGSLYIQSHYVNGQLQGRFTVFHKNQTVKSTCYKCKGKTHGEFIAYWPNGNFYLKSLVDNGNTIKESIRFFDQNGKCVIDESACVIC